MDPALVTLIVGVIGSPVAIELTKRWRNRPRKPKSADERIDVLEADVRAMRIEQRHTLDYVEELRVHISNGRPPPPPPWPEVLTRRDP